MARDAKLREVASNTAGLSGADIELLCQRASIIAIREHLSNRKRKLKITGRHFSDALNEIKSKIIANVELKNERTE